MNAADPRKRFTFANIVYTTKQGETFGTPYTELTIAEMKEHVIAMLGHEPKWIRIEPLGEKQISLELGCPKVGAWLEAYKAEWPQIREMWQGQGLNDEKINERLKSVAADWYMRLFSC